ncbi:MAG TPA: FG-GAP-like repeat-containing protein, partial [Syntrophales bacterium]|nr:FG-GAP-like repeat-containing protein [Syntrophales bacterium]
GAEYRTEIETFSKIVSYGNTGGGPTSFKVWTKDGLIMEYGNTDDSKIHVQNDTGILLWTLNRIKDRNGNEMNFTYASDGQNQEFWPTRIEYAYVNGTARCYVAFEYDDARPDSETRYVAGSPRRTTKLLRNIKTYAGNYLVKNYLLDYEGGSTYRSRLKRVTECRDADECLPPTTFAWQDTEPGFDSVDIDAPDYLFDNTIIGDFNGDGKKDLARPGNLSKAMVMLSNGNGFDAAANWGGFIFPPPGSKTGDANGDGKTDILGSLNDSISKKDQDGFSTRLASSLPYLAADFNGDGRDDIFFNYSQDDWKIQRSNGTSFVNWLTLTIDKDLEDSTLDTGDFNGDGVADIIQFERTVTEIIILGEISTLISEKWSVLLSNEGGFNDKQTWVDEGLDEDSIIDEHFLGDFNGDGKTDVLIFNSENDANVSYVRFSNGEGFEPKTQFNTDHVSLSAKLGDFNGDGKTDILQVEEGNSYVWFSTGSGFVKSDIAWGADHSDEDLVGDFNGDGRTDVIQLGKNLTEIQWVDCSQGGIPLVCPEEVEVVEYTYYLWCSKPGSPDLITGITTGLGAETNITYTPITDSEVYTRYCTADYPLKDYQGAMNVVSYYNVSNGIGGSNEYSYTYEGATVDVERRRFQGFSKITEFDHQKSITTQTAYITRYPFTGMISSRVISDQSHTILSMGNIYEAYSYLNGTASGPFAEGAPI